MLRTLRNYDKNLLTKIPFILLFILLIASFALWGISDVFFDNRREVTIAKVGDISIDSEDFLRHYRNQTRQIADLLGPQFNAQRGRDLGFVDMSLSTLVTRALFDNEVQTMGLSISESEVRRAIFTNPDFLDSMGMFNEIDFRRLLRDAGYSEVAFVEDLGQDLRRLQLTDTVKHSLSTPQAMAQPLTLFRQESRVGESVMIDPEKIPKPRDPGDEVLKAWFEKNRSNFVDPEYRSLKYLAITPQHLARDIDIAESDVREMYDMHAEAYVTPERRWLLQMLLEDESTARAAHQALTNGGDFTKIAAEIANQDEKDIDLEWNQRNEMITELEDPVFDLTQGAISDPISSPFGWHIVKVVGIEPRSVIAYEEAKDTIHAALALEEAAEATYALSRRVEDVFAAGETLQDAATSIDLPLIDIPRVDDKGKDDQDKMIANLPQPGRFLSHAFSLKKGEESTSLIETDKEGFFAIQVETITPSRPLDFTQARAKVLLSWQEKRKEEQARQQGDDILKALKEGADFADIAQTYDLTLSLTEDFTRSTFAAQDIPAPLAEGLFDADNIGDTLSVKISEGVIIARLADIRPADIDSQSLIASVRETIEREVGDDLLQQYAAYLRRHYPVSVDDRTIDDIL